LKLEKRADKVTIEQQQIQQNDLNPDIIFPGVIRLLSTHQQDLGMGAEAVRIDSPNRDQIEGTLDEQIQKHILILPK